MNIVVVVFLIEIKRMLHTQKVRLRGQHRAPFNPWGGLFYMGILSLYPLRRKQINISPQKLTFILQDRKLSLYVTHFYIYLQYSNFLSSNIDIALHNQSLSALLIAIVKAKWIFQYILVLRGTELTIIVDIGIDVAPPPYYKTIHLNLSDSPCKTLAIVQIHFKFK